MDALWEKLDREHAFFIFNIDTENEDPNCMTTEGPHRSATPLGGKQRRAAPTRGRGIEGSPESSDGKSGDKIHKLAATRRMLEEQRRQLAVIIDWIRSV